MVNPKTLISRQGKYEMSSSKVDKLRKKMRKNGYDIEKPIEIAEVDGYLIIIDGHHRAQAAMRERLREVPIIKRETNPEIDKQLLKEAIEASPESFW
jgi:filamentous hemagglutinin